MTEKTIYAKQNAELASLEGLKNDAISKMFNDYDKGVTAVVKDPDAVKTRKNRYIGNRRSQAAIIRQLRRDDPSGYQKQKTKVAEIHENIIAKHIVDAEQFWSIFIGLKKADTEEMVAREAEILENLYDFRFKAIFDTEPFEDGKHVDMVVQ